MRCYKSRSPQSSRGVTTFVSSSCLEYWHVMSMTPHPICMAADATHASCISCQLQKEKEIGRGETYHAVRELSDDTLNELS